MATDSGNVEAVEALLAWGADVNARLGGPGWETIDDPEEPALGSTPLHMAALGLDSHFELRYLLGPAFEVYLAEMTSVISILLSAGADISAKDAKGRTALEVAEWDEVKAVLQAAIAKI